MNPEKSSSADLVKILEGDADLQLKARACQHLAIVGDEAAIPALAKLLGDVKLADFARCALENIPSPAAAAALREALGKLQGSVRAGVVNSLGVLRDREAVPALISLVPQADSGALAALGQIADDAAVAEILKQLAGADPRQAAHAALKASQVAASEDRAEVSAKLLEAVGKAKLPDYFHSAAKAAK